jgi:hypothetical protein
MAILVHWYSVILQKPRGHASGGSKGFFHTDDFTSGDCFFEKPGVDGSVRGKEGSKGSTPSLIHGCLGRAWVEACISPKAN